MVSVSAVSRTVRCFQASDGLFSQATCPDILLCSAGFFETIVLRSVKPRGGETSYS